MGALRTKDKLKDAAKAHVDMLDSALSGSCPTLKTLRSNKPLDAQTSVAGSMAMGSLPTSLEELRDASAFAIEALSLVAERFDRWFSNIVKSGPSGRSAGLLAWSQSSKRRVMVRKDAARTLE